MITAANPGKQLTADENERRRLELADELASRDVPFVRVTGSSPDRSHREESFAVALDRDDAAGLARRFGQEAIFW